MRASAMRGWESERKQDQRDLADQAWLSLREHGHRQGGEYGATEREVGPHEIY